jgi:hypothetical protein
MFLKLWYAVVWVVCDSFGRKGTAKIVSGTEWMKNTPMYVYAKTAFVAWPSTESRGISYFHNLSAIQELF